MVNRERFHDVDTDIEETGIIGYVRIKPPLENMKEYLEVCGVAYETQETDLPQPTERDFENSLFDGATELRFFSPSKERLRLAAERITDKLAG